MTPHRIAGFGKFLLSLLIFLALSLVLYRLSYTDFLSFCRPYLPPGYNISALSSRFLSPKIFTYIKYLGFILIFLTSTLFYLTLRFRKKILHKIRQLTFYFKTSLYLKKNERFPLFFTLFCALSAVSLAAAAYPLHIDEAFSYIFLVSRGFFVTLSYYPGPNNHPAYLLLSVLVDGFANAPLPSMRLPNIFFSVIFSLQLYYFLRKHFDTRTALLSIWLFFLTPHGLFYLAHGRGYLLFAVCTLAMLDSGLCWITHKKNTPLFIFSLSCVVGFFTIPSFLYPFVSFVPLLFFWVIAEKNTKKLAHLVVAMGGIFVGTLLLYAPILIFNPLATIFKNPWVAPLSRQKWIALLPDKLIAYLQFPFGESLLAISLTLLAIGTLVFAFVHIRAKKNRTEKHRKNKLLLASVSLIFAPLLLSALQSVHPPLRSWFYQLPIFSAAMAYVFLNNQFIKKTTKKPRFFILLFLFIGLWAFFNITSTLKTVEKQSKIYRQCQNIADFLYKQKAQKVFVGKDIYNVFLRLRYLKSEHRLKIETPPARLSRHFDYLVLPSRQPLPKHLGFILVCKDDFVCVYEKKPKQ